MAASSRFEIERELGRGGAGVVWAARDRERGGERVALKRLAGEGDPAALRREFEMLRRLRHPVIVGVRDFGIDAEGAWLAMELVEGEELGAFAGKVGPEQVTAWALLLADALEYARRRGIVHGDLKPGNVLVPHGAAATVKLLDLGFAGLAGSAARGGTPEYIAPEVLRGEAPDARADLFALGAVLYQCLAGHPPFAGIDRSRPADALPDTVPERLRAVIAALLKPRPDERPGRAADLVLLLGDAPGLRLPLPEGDLVGREHILAAVRKGQRVLVEVGPGLGATRLAREIAELAAAEGLAPRIALYRPGTAPRPSGDEFVVLAAEPLAPAELEAMVRSRLPLEDTAVRAIAAWVGRESAGIPALAVEALECLRDSGLLEPGPLGLGCAVERLGELRPEARSGSRVAAQVAALTPAERRVRAAAGIAGSAAGEPAMLARRLEGELAPGERARLHAEAAKAQIAGGAVDAGRIADHLLAAGSDGEAGPWLVRAAEQARAAGDRRATRARLLLAVDRLAPGAERAEARLALAREETLAGQADRALELFRAAAAEAPALAAAALVGEAELHAARKDHAAARRAAVAAIRLSRGAGGERDRAGALLVLGRVTAQRGEYDTARRHLDGAQCLFRELSDGAQQARAALALGNTEFLAQRFDDALEAWQAAREAAERSGEPRARSLALQNLAMIYAYHRRSASEARTALLAAVAAAEEEGDPARLARALSHLAVLEFDSGHGDEARRHLERGLHLRERAGDRTGVVGDRVLLGEILTTAGRFAEARAVLDQALEEAVDSGERRLEVGALDELGRHALEVTDPAAARSYLERAVRTARATGQEDSEARSRALLASAHLELGDSREAQRVLAVVSRGFEDSPEVVARLARARAGLLLAEQRPAEAVRMLERALKELQQAGYELEMARTLLYLGLALGQQGNQESGLAALERARTIFDRHGAKPSLARTLLAKARVKLGSFE